MRHDYWPTPEQFPNGSVVTMGVFDGFHRGHQQLLARAVARGEESGLPVALVTFDPHPLAVLAPERSPVELMSASARAEYALAHGADHVVVLPFTRELAEVNAAAFIRTGLVAKLQCRWLVVGSNFRCGKDGVGDLAFIERAARRLDFGVEAVALVERGARTCSSTAIREALKAGDLPVARDLLGRADPHILGMTDV